MYFTKKINMKNELNIVISCDDNYLKHAIILLKSVADNNIKDFKKICIHLLAHNLSEKAKNIISKDSLNFGLEIKIYDLSNLKEKLGIKVPSTIAINSYSRLFISSLLSTSIDTVIYMDSDAIVNGSLKDLMEMNIQEYSVGGVLDDVSTRAKIKVNLQSNDPYINAGFLLINLKFWRDNNIEKLFLNFLYKNNGNVFHHDQGIINAICRDSIKILNPQYNMVSNFFVHSYQSFKQIPFYSKEEIQEGMKEPIFIHFTPGVVNRPWFKNCKHPYKNLYLKYKSQTRFSNEIIPFDNRPFKLRLLSFLFFHYKWAYHLLLKIRNNYSHKI